MEKGTVTISIKEYDDLRELKKKIKEGNIYTISESWYSHLYSCSSNIRFYTNNEVIKAFEEHINKLTDKIDKLEHQINNKDEKCREKDKLNKIAIENVRQMGWFEFKKWKRDSGQN